MLNWLNMAVQKNLTWKLVSTSRSAAFEAVTSHELLSLLDEQNKTYCITKTSISSVKQSKVPDIYVG